MVCLHLRDVTRAALDHNGIDPQTGNPTPQDMDDLRLLGVPEVRLLGSGWIGLLPPTAEVADWLNIRLCRWTYGLPGILLAQGSSFARSTKMRCGCLSGRSLRSAMPDVREESVAHNNHIATSLLQAGHPCVPLQY